LDPASLPTVTLAAAQTAARDAAVAAATDAVVRRRYAEAKRQAEAALAIDPRAARARAVRGFVLLQEAGRVDPPALAPLHEGESEVATATALAPDDAFVGYMHAVFLAESGHMSAAAATAEAALQATKSAPAAERAALLGIAGTYRYELGEDRAARPHLQDYVALRPDDAAAQYRLGCCLLRLAALPLGPNGKTVAQQQAEAAAVAFARCYALAPADEGAGLAVGKARLRGARLAAERGEAEAAQKLRQAAEAQFAAVAAAFATSAEPWYCVAVAAEERGDRAAADAAYAEALRRDPLHVGSLLNVAAAMDGGDVEGLRKTLQRVLFADDARGELTAGERDAVQTRLAALAARRDGDQKPRIE
jgi:tetratricopeptide (TPR) repeat protein